MVSTRDGSSTWAMYLVQILSILPCPSPHLKNIGKCKYFVKNSSTSTKYFENFSQVQSSTLNTLCFIMVKVKAMKT